MDPPYIYRAHLLPLLFEYSTADVKAKVLLEGSSTIRARSLHAKMINGDHVSIAAHENIIVEAMYAKESSIHSKKGHVTVGMLKGHIEVRTSSRNGANLPTEFVSLIVPFVHLVACALLNRRHRVEGALYRYQVSTGRLTLWRIGEI
jgi:hypothetical protein